MAQVGGAVVAAYVAGHCSDPHRRTLTPHPDCRYAWVFGGIDSSNGALNDLWMLDLQTGAWTERNADGATPAARRGASFVVLSQKVAYLYAGESASMVRWQDMFLLHLGSGSSTVPRWEAVVYPDLLTVPPARTEHTATVVPLFEKENDPLGMIVFGGMDGGSLLL